MKKIISEDFKDFPLEEFPYDHEHSALGEYHFFPAKGYKGNFYDPICLHQWRSMGGSWLVTENDGYYYMEQNRGDNTKGHFQNVFATLVHKEDIYAPYTLTCKMMLLKTGVVAGIAFNYVHNRLYNAILIDGSYIYVVKRDGSLFTLYDKKAYIVNSLDLFDLTLEVSNYLTIKINNEEIMKVSVSFKLNSKVAFVSKCPVRYTHFEVYLDENNYLKHLNLKEYQNKQLALKQSKYCPIECIKKIDLKNFGSARQLRFGLDKNNNPVFILAQHQKRMYRDSFARLSSLTAFNLDGDILWTIGQPCNSLENTLISCDLPMQIADINNDGLNEVIFARDFYVYIISLDTGKILAKMKTPFVKNDPNLVDYPYDYLNPDGLRVVDLQKRGYKGDFILKDRYHNVWAYSAFDFQLLWKYNHKNTGHFPYVGDINSDGYDELLIGYDLVDHKGNILWSLDIKSDHTDEIIYLKEKEQFYLASGNEGFNIIDKEGKIVKSNDVGHAQRISIASYLPSYGLTVAVTSFWGADQIVYLFDLDGNKLYEKELITSGNLVSPVAYDGTNELILMNTSLLSGLYDGKLDLVVSFPDDGHPTLASEVIDIDNDGISEIITWDQKQMWIYKASQYKVGNRYEKYPDNAFSNYRGEYLLKKN